jgi:hypothetical protein
MIAWEPNGVDAASALLTFAIVIGGAELLTYGLPSWWPAPLGAAALFIIVALAIGVAIVRKPK